MDLLVKIKNYEQLYAITNDGRVWSYPKITSTYSHSGKWLKPINNGNGYLQVVLRKDNKSKKKYIHRLVAKAFIDNLNDYSCINHKDGIKSNNDVDNLEWCTYSMNNQHAQDTGLSMSRYSKKQKESISKIGKSNRVLENEQVQNILELYKHGTSIENLLMKFNVSKSTIYRIITNRDTYKDFRNSKTIVKWEY